MTRLILLAHGSPDPRSAAAVRAAAAGVADRSGAGVEVAFLDHDAPSLAEAVSASADSGDVDVLPLLLSRAFHARVDVPAAIAGLSRPVRLLDPLGHPPGVLDALLLRSGSGPVAVVAAGTRVEIERDAFSTAVQAAAARTGVDAVPAFLTGPGPSLTQVLAGAAAPVAVLAWLLAPGRLLDRVHDRAGEHPVLAPAGLLAEPSLRDELVRRARVPLARAGAG